ncbi:MAG: glycosyl transferase [Gammaproteobacteria bacterium]|nr:glycosyl transferase [Gammaproteobacteria bacterium]
MSDFFQNGIVTTLHDLGGRQSFDLEQEVARYAEHQPITLVLPCLVSELEGAAIGPIIDTLATISYIDHIIIGLDRADQSGYAKALRMFARQGKGQNLWICFGLLQARSTKGVVAIHDCDILNYRSRLLARLVYPLVKPATSYVFAKGYYARVSEHVLYGRVSRLFVTPLLRALKRSLAPSRYLDYLDSFRYPLAGECAMHVDVARRLHLTMDWGLEIGTLSEVFRDHSTRQICQVDIADTYDHKHQSLGQSSKDTGLNRMARDIALSVLQGLAAQGQILDKGHLRTVVTAYQRIVLDLMESYENDAAINGLMIDRGGELSAASVFAAALHEAGRRFVEEDCYRPLTPLWDEVMRSYPDILSRLAFLVTEDKAEFGA